MKGILLNLCNIISSMSLVDLLFLATLVILIILVISLIYILKGNSYVEVTRNEQVDSVIEEVKVENQKKDEPLDLPTLTKILENAPKKNIELTPYEEEQEEKAIISYDELVKAKSNLMINYEDEKEEDGVLVKKIDLANLTTVVDAEEEESKIDSRATVTISYEREEAFLQALKQLQQMLNS